MTDCTTGPRPFHPLREYALLVVLAALWGGSYPLVKISLESMPPVSLVAFRIALAAAILRRRLA